MSEDFEKYLAIANHDIQVANNMSELKSYIASILWDNDKKTELLQQKENIIKEVREYMKSIEHEPDADMYIELGQYKEYKHILEILDKENI